MGYRVYRVYIGVVTGVILGYGKENGNHHIYIYTHIYIYGIGCRV